MNNLIILFFILILISGCATAPPVATTSGKPVPPLQQSASMPRADWAVGANVWMKASLKIAFPELNQNISATIEIAKMDSILINISAMFGISVGKMFATPYEFIMNNNMESTSYIGQPTSANLMKVAFIDLSYSDLLCVLKCVPPQIGGGLPTYALDTVAGAYVYKTDSFIESLSFDNGRLSSLQRTDNLGNELLTISYSGHRQIGQHWFATSIGLAFPQAGGAVNIALTDIQIDKVLSSPMRFAIPTSYEIIDY